MLKSQNEVVVAQEPADQQLESMVNPWWAGEVAQPQDPWVYRRCAADTRRERHWDNWVPLLLILLLLQQRKYKSARSWLLTMATHLNQAFAMPLATANSDYTDRIRCWCHLPRYKNCIFSIPDSKYYRYYFSRRHKTEVNLNSSNYVAPCSISGAHISYLQLWPILMEKIIHLKGRSGYGLLSLIIMFKKKRKDFTDSLVI